MSYFKTFNLRATLAAVQKPTAQEAHMAAKKKVKKTSAKGGGKVIIAMLRRANGCTREEVLKETG
jgi:hypothetical protein